MSSRRGFIGRCLAGLVGVGALTTGAVVKAVSPEEMDSTNVAKDYDLDEVIAWVRRAQQHKKFIPPIAPPPPPPSSPTTIWPGDEQPGCFLVYDADNRYEYTFAPQMELGTKKDGRIVFNAGGWVA